MGLPGVHIECKRVERLNMPTTMQQAMKDPLRFRDGMTEEFPIAPVKSQIRQLPKPSMDLSFAKFNFDEEDPV